MQTSISISGSERESGFLSGGEGGAVRRDQQQLGRRVADLGPVGVVVNVVVGDRCDDMGYAQRRIRQRLGIEVFARLFEKVVDLCQAAGLVWGQELFFDATKVRANADLDSLVPRFSYEARTRFADLFAEEAAEASRRADAPASPDEASAEIVRLPTMPATAGPPAAAPDP